MSIDFDKLMELTGKAVSADIRQRCAEAGQMTLGELEARLQALPPDMPIRFDDGRHPGELMSYRGYYDHVAIDGGDALIVRRLLERVTAAIGSTMAGYKGGDFRMTRHTPVWVSEYGDNSGIGAIGLEIRDGQAVLITKEIDE